MLVHMNTQILLQTFTHLSVTFCPISPVEVSLEKGAGKGEAGGAPGSADTKRIAKHVTVSV